MHNNCKCVHHWIVKTLVFLAWVAGVLFFWSSWGTRTFWGFDSLYWAWSVVILVLLAKSTKFCGCCGFMSVKGGSVLGGDKNMCSHEGGCKCGDCGKCC